MTVEPPRGVRSNLQRSFSGGPVSEKWLQESFGQGQSNGRKAVWSNLVLGLCTFHALLLERKKYGCLGWNIPYEFNDADLEVALLQLRMLRADDEDVIPWSALRYMAGDVAYGGRVTDDTDRRCLRSLLAKFYTPKALEPGYVYSSDGVYHPLAEERLTFPAMRAYIDQLPASDSPALFGMNASAERACLEAQADELIATLLGSQTHKAAGPLGCRQQEDSLVLGMISDLLERVPRCVESEDEGEEQRHRQGGDTTRPGGRSKGQGPRLLLRDLMKVSAKPGKVRARSRGGEDDTAGRREDKGRTEPDEAGLRAVRVLCQSALFTVLRQEVVRFNSLLTEIRGSLRALRRAVRGEVVMSQALEEAYTALLGQRVPHQWRRVAYESRKSVGSWVTDLLQRVDFFRQWAERVTEASQKALRPPAPLPPPGGQGRKSNLAVREPEVGSPSPSPPPPAPLELSSTQPGSFLLSAFFFPQGFLTAVLQQHARKHVVSVDSLKFSFKVAPTSAEEMENLREVKDLIRELAFKGQQTPDEGVLVFGLHLDGATWDFAGGTLGDCMPGERFSRLPEIHFIPIQEEARAGSSSLDLPQAESAPDEARAGSSSLDLPQAESAPDEARAGSSSLDLPQAESAPDEARAGSSSLDLPQAESAPDEADTETGMTSHLYESPLYRTSSRAGALSSTGHSTNLVTLVSLPSQHPPEFWVMRGVALTCQLDD